MPGGAEVPMEQQHPHTHPLLNKARQKVGYKRPQWALWREHEKREAREREDRRQAEMEEKQRMEDKHTRWKESLRGERMKRLDAAKHNHNRKENVLSQAPPPPVTTVCFAPSLGIAGSVCQGIRSSASARKGVGGSASARQDATSNASACMVVRGNNHIIKRIPERLSRVSPVRKSLDAQIGGSSLGSFQKHKHDATFNLSPSHSRPAVPLSTSPARSAGAASRFATLRASETEEERERDRVALYGGGETLGEEEGAARDHEREKENFKMRDELYGS
eukprot:Cvel_32281.t1-p1 / transcript=Cvel_32281.t1 / gene=Cvel_32281 / organism=Chromera_velia_CCMP2878 / gene_product=hypothetical protein / transcript_product=hypothetical protein / location=Cvel_scaffold4984:5919-6748(+) / protein_length=276 / sequence_SO=supercontig / SO=protein_coding / is_pseudo=false